MGDDSNEETKEQGRSTSPSADVSVPKNEGPRRSSMRLMKRDRKLKELKELKDGWDLNDDTMAIRNRLYECTMKRDRKALQNLLKHPLIVGKLETFEIEAADEVAESVSLALMLLDNVMATAGSKGMAVDTLETALAACASVGIDSSLLTEALTELSIAYGQTSDTAVQQMNREILGALFARNTHTIQRLIQTCEKRTINTHIIGHAKKVLNEMHHQKKQIRSALANGFDEVVYLRVAMNSAVAMVPKSDSALKEILKMLHEHKSGVRKRRRVPPQIVKHY